MFQSQSGGCLPTDKSDVNTTQRHLQLWDAFKITLHKRVIRKRSLTQQALETKERNFEVILMQLHQTVGQPAVLHLDNDLTQEESSSFFLGWHGLYSLVPPAPETSVWPDAGSFFPFPLVCFYACSLNSVHNKACKLLSIMKLLLLFAPLSQCSQAGNTSREFFL